MLITTDNCQKCKKLLTVLFYSGKVGGIERSSFNCKSGKENTLTDLVTPVKKSMKMECVLRTACCPTEGGKPVGGRCALCGAVNPDTIWVDPMSTQCVTPTETRRMCTPRKVPSTGGYVPLSVRNGELQYASTVPGSSWCAGPDNSSTQPPSGDQVLEGIDAEAVA